MNLSFVCCTVCALGGECICIFPGSINEFIGCVLTWHHLVNACEIKAHLIGCWQNLGTICFWQSIHSGLNLVVVAVLRDSLCVVSLLPCMADCCMLYTACKVERFVLSIIKRRLLVLLLLLLLLLFVWSAFVFCRRGTDASCCLQNAAVPRPAH